MKFYTTIAALLLATTVNAHGTDGVPMPLDNVDYHDDTTSHTIYRAYTTKWNKLGRWWSFTKPEGDKDAYRKANAICSEWSDLTYVVQCTLSTPYITGTTSEVQCDNTAYLDNTTVQVFIPDASMLTNCVELGEWDSP